jgi:hypothetical protein
MKRSIMLIAAGAISLVSLAAFAQERPAERGRGARSIMRLCAVDQAWAAQRMGERLARRLNLTDQQKPALKDLQDAFVKSRNDTKAALCAGKPDLSNLPARLAFAQKRLQARLDGLKAMQPKLEAFYSALNGEQQAELDRLWRGGGMGGGRQGRAEGRGDGEKRSGGGNGGSSFDSGEDD